MQQLAIFAIAMPVVFLLFVALISGGLLGLVIAVLAGLFFGALIAVLFSPLLVGKKNKEIIELEIKKCKEYISKITNAFYADFNAYFDEKGMITPSALVYSSHEIIIVDRGVLKKIKKENIVSWFWKIPGYTHREVFSDQPINPITNYEIDQANIKDAVIAAMQSGLFITINDIEKPVWQFMCSDQKVLERWNEIFRQISTGEIANLPPG